MNFTQFQLVKGLQNSQKCRIVFFKQLYTTHPYAGQNIQQAFRALCYSLKSEKVSWTDPDYRALFLADLVFAEKSEWLTEHSCESKVTELYDPLFCDENVFRFYISVDAVVQVAVVDSLQRLPDQAHRRRHWDTMGKKIKICFLF